MSLTKLKLTSQCKNHTPSHLELGTVINDICPHHLPQLPSQTHAYLLHSEADSSSEYFIPLPFSSSMLDLKPLTIPSPTHFEDKMKPPSTTITLYQNSIFQKLKPAM